MNCAALHEELLESELFGHVKGAFTGAVRDRQGRFEAADGGTLFLDEIAEISPSVQVKLLRVIQSKEFERVGDNATRRVDVRIIAATNRDLKAALEEGTFREDLFYRLNAVRLKALPLRQRPEDVVLLVNHFIRKFSPRNRVTVAPEAMKALRLCPWRGNVRELENVIERAVLLAKNGVIQPGHLPEEVTSETSGEPAAVARGDGKTAYPQGAPPDRGFRGGGLGSRNRPHDPLEEKGEIRPLAGRRSDLSRFFVDWIHADPKQERMETWPNPITNLKNVNGTWRRKRNRKRNASENSAKPTPRKKKNSDQQAGTANAG